MILWGWVRFVPIIGPIYIAYEVATTVAEIILFIWSNEVQKIRGKTVAIFGVRSVGKTVLFDFLTEGIKSCGFTVPSLYGVKTKSRKFQLGDTEINLEESVDVPGDEYRDWQNIFNRSDIVLYLVRANILLKDPQLLTQAERKEVEQVRTDLSMVQRWRNGRPGKKYFIIGAHCDLIPGFDYDKKILILTRFKELEIVKTRAAGMISVIGSLTEDNIDRLVSEVFKNIV